MFDGLHFGKKVVIVVVLLSCWTIFWVRMSSSNGRFIAGDSHNGEGLHRLPPSGDFEFLSEQSTLSEPRHLLSS